MKVTICTTPIRPVSTDYPPFGSLAVIQSLRAAGYDPYFYDIDGLRPGFDKVVQFFADQQPHVVGISAVVSTAYAYTKRLAQALRRVVPNATIVVGGNLAASAEILHRLCGVDYCVIGEGERVSVNLMRYLEHNGRERDYETLGHIKGLSFLQNGSMTFTGYEMAIPRDELFEPDYTILEQYSRIENFINDPLSRSDFAQDSRTNEPKRAGKRMATVLTAKGCVARCTFCHRWEKGYRAFPVDQIVKQIRYLIDGYNVGFIQFGDENFGSDRRQVDELIAALTPLDILYNVAGVRCRTVDPNLLGRLKASGCVALYYGMESGSQRILDVMEKNTTVEVNANAARWTHDAGLQTVYQMVLAMPGVVSHDNPLTISHVGS